MISSINASKILKVFNKFDISFMKITLRKLGIEVHLQKYNKQKNIYKRKEGKKSSQLIIIKGLKV